MNRDMSRWFAIVSLLIIRPIPLQASSKEVPMLEQIREGLGYARRSAVIRDLLILTGVASVFGLQYGTLPPKGEPGGAIPSA